MVVVAVAMDPFRFIFSPSEFSSSSSSLLLRLRLSSTVEARREVVAMAAARRVPVTVQEVPIVNYPHKTKKHNTW